MLFRSALCPDSMPAITWIRMRLAPMDSIRRQLQLLDERLDERTGAVRGIVAQCPLLMPAVAFIAAIVVENYFAIPLMLLMALVLMAVLAAGVSPWSGNHRRRLYLTATAACLAMACTGAVRLKCFYRAPPEDIRNLIGDEPTLATMRGVVKTSPRYDNRNSWKFGRYTWAGESCSFYLGLREVKAKDRWAPASGTVRVQLSGDPNNIESGDYIQVYCRLSRFGEPLNPGQFDIKRSMERRNIHVSATVKSADGIELLQKGPSTSWRRLIGRIKTIASQALLGDNLEDENASAILAALLLGQRSNIDAETAAAFQKTNLAHFISLSGMHLGILAITFWWLCKIAGCPKGLRGIICAAVIALYVLIVPPRAPTLRAAAICWVFCLSVVVRRKPNALNTLSLAAIILLLIKPTDLFTAGWQLSYTTVLGIVLLERPISNWILERTIDRVESPKPSNYTPHPLAVWSKALLSWAIRLFSMGFAAWLGGAGILLYHFGTIGPLASLWTVLVFPLVWLILVGGFLKMVLAFFLPTLALMLGLLLIHLANSLSAFVKLLAGTGLSQILIGQVAGALTICYYTFVGVVRFTHIQRPLLRRALYASLIVLIVVPLAILKYRRANHKYLELTALSVGHGQAIVAALPGKSNLIFDAGSFSIKNCGGRVVAGFLRHKGISNIDTLFVSHDDIDHINGIPEIVAACNVRRICANAAVIQKATTSSMAGYLDYCLKNQNHNINLLADEMTFHGDTRIRSLWPTLDICQDPNVSNNDKSQVILIEFAGRKILLTGDIELGAQEQLLKLHPKLKIDVLVMPHHGSTRKLVDGFAERLGAKTVIVSCRHTRYPTAWRPRGDVRAFYTPVDGAITVTIKADGALSTAGFVNNTNSPPIEPDEQSTEHPRI
ncbi:MAG: DNA internalization-related competence protein ComEC/Rec2 [Planctomycetes bacterium]|nr:DNA internalization-related competence protein ComEC/Rec2 [Planctomycetota bacterium]